MKVFERFDELAKQDSPGRPHIAFGISSNALAKALRAFADSVEKGDALVQSVRELSLAHVDEYPLTTLRITFVDTTLGVSKERVKQ